MSSPQPTDFHRFLELPFDIRWEIYELCLPKRVIDSVIHILPAVPKYLMTTQEQLALRHIVAKFSRTPVIARASTEVYRAMRRHLVAPPRGEWVWNRDSWCAQGFTDPRPIYFDPKSDVLSFSPEDWHVPQIMMVSGCSDVSPFCLAEARNVNLALDKEAIRNLVTSKKLADHWLLGRKKCTIILNETVLISTAKWIASCGLFGLFGEERTVLVDVDDFERIDYFDKKLNGEGLVDGEVLRPSVPVPPDGIRRYSSHSNFNLEKTWHEDSPLVSAEERVQIITEDKNMMTRQIRENWLEVNGCFDSTKLDDASPVPSKGESGDRDFDEEHPNAQPWYRKLPAFSFAVRVYAQDLEEAIRLSSAKAARQYADRRRLAFGVGPMTP